MLRPSNDGSASTLRARLHFTAHVATSVSELPQGFWAHWISVRPAIAVPAASPTWPVRPRETASGCRVAGWLEACCDRRGFPVRMTRADGIPVCIPVHGPLGLCRWGARGRLCRASSNQRIYVPTVAVLVFICVEPSCRSTGRQTVRTLVWAVG